MNFDYFLTLRLHTIFGKLAFWKEKMYKFLTSSKYHNFLNNDGNESKSSPFDCKFNVDVENGVKREIWISESRIMTS